MGNLIAWIVLGLIAGAIAKLVYPGSQGGGIVATTILGIVGALLGGYLGQVLLGSSGAAAASVGSLTLGSLFFSVIGAIIVIFLWGLITSRAA
jgi:uncharacterized membrane protein YeaQ/YmgE (transglycosylase-associated protein family)